MMRFVVPAALAVLALCAPAASQAQIIGSTGPIPLHIYPQAGDITAAPTTYSDDGFLGSGYYQGEDFGYRATDFGPALAPAPTASIPSVGVTRVRVQGHYSWDPTRQTNVWIEGQYVRSPQ